MQRQRLMAAFLNPLRQRSWRVRLRGLVAGVGNRRAGAEIAIGVAELGVQLSVAWPVLLKIRIGWHGCDIDATLETGAPLTLRVGGEAHVLHGGDADALFRRAGMRPPVKAKTLAPGVRRFTAARMRGFLRLLPSAACRPG